MRSEERLLIERAYDELYEVLNSCNENVVHFDGDHFHELLKALKEYIASDKGK